MKKVIISVMLLLSLVVRITYAVDSQDLYESYTARAKVLEVTPLEEEDGNDIFTETMLVKIKILNGKFKGEVVEIDHALTGSFGYDIIVKPGDRVLLTIDEFKDGTVEIGITEYIRDTYIYAVTIGFVLVIIVIGRSKGLKAVITLGLTIFLIVKILLPGILKGMNPIPLTMIISLIITFVTIFVVAGVNVKSLSAIIGVLSGVTIAGLIAFIVGTKVKLTGLSAEEAGMLLYIPQNIEFDFRGLLFSGIIMGALGAVMDVGISIASSMEEIKKANPSITTKELITAGMNVGKDIMGTMSNTLILAYTGSSIPLMLLFLAYETELERILNFDVIATEIIRALSGSIGLILTIPITVLTSALLFEKFSKNIPEEKDI